MSANALRMDDRKEAARAGGVLERWARARVFSRLERIRGGRLEVVDAWGRHAFGESGAALRGELHVTDPRFYRAMALRGALGGAEAYMDGWCHCDDLTAVVRILEASRDSFARIERSARWIRPGLALLHALRHNSRAGSRRNIAAHYDLGNEFFGLFLDPTLTYSCGLFESPEASMEEASRAKLERICRKLRLRSTDHVLEIGGGWGSFALHAASCTGCRVTTTTVSRRQLELARERVAEAGLSDRVQVLFEDYRDLRGRYDKLVSIEMIEAVGHRHLDEFFRVCGERLCPDGTMVLQAITVPDRSYASHVRNVDFVKRYIFPGGELVSIGAVGGAVARSSDLRLTHLEDLTPHYAETLRRWHERMLENLPAMRALGLDERFLRMWEFYLCYCEAGFRERDVGLVQAVFEKPGSRRAPLMGSLVAEAS